MFYFLLINSSGYLLIKVIGGSWFLHDLNQGGTKLPATYTFTSTDADMHSKLIKLVEKAREKYNQERNEIDTIEKKIKANTKKYSKIL